MLSWQSIHFGLALPALNPKNIGEERKMKKRLLALALCLVLATSLLPITAAADIYDDILIQGITVYGKYCGDTYFTISVPENVSVRHVTWACEKLPKKLEKDNRGRYMLAADYGAGQVHIFFDGQIGDQFIIPLTIYPQHVWSDWTSNGNGTHSRSCKNGCGTTPQTASCADTSPADCKCDDCGASMHIWRYTRTENSLTAECGNSGCTIGKVGVTLTASSVTLPTSPFNAQVILNGITEEEIKEEFGYLISPIRYKFKAPGDSAFMEITPADGAREGTYQAAVTLSPISTTFSARSTADPNSVTLYTQYTAVNPETTAQTGDDRPIELMMGSVVVFSALAAAAFILDSKRRSQQ